MSGFYDIVSKKNFWENKLSKHITCYVNNYYQVDLKDICFECRKTIRRMEYWEKELKEELKPYD